MSLYHAPMSLNITMMVAFSVLHQLYTVGSKLAHSHEVSNSGSYSSGLLGSLSGSLL